MKKTKKSKKSGGGKGVDFGRYLRGLNKHLDKAKETAATGGFEEFDDGKYRARCVDAKIGVSKSKRVQVVLTWKFVKGDYKGKEKLDFEGLTEDHLPYLLKKLDAMGYDTTEIEDLETELKEFLADIKKTKPECKITLKTKGEFQNVYVDNLIGEEEDEEDEEDDEDESEEDSDEDDEDDDEDDEDEEPKKKKKGKSKKSKKKDDDDEEDDDSEDEDDDSDDDDEDEEDSDEDDEDSDDDDDEEEEKPKKKGKKKKGKKDDDEDDEDEDEDNDEEDEEEEEVEDEVDVVVGSVITVDSKKEGKVKGKVVETFEADGKVLIKTDKGKSLKISVDKILSVEESPSESVPKKKKKSKK